MNQVHIHLLISHLPIFGSILGAIVLAHALLTKSNETKIAAYFLFVISALGAGIVYLTGEGAEEAVEKLPGILESTIERHEDFALISLVALIILGASALFGIFTIRKINWSRNIGIIILIISLLSFGLVARTGYLGGLIKHTEMNGVNTNQEQEKVKSEDYFDK